MSPARISAVVMTLNEERNIDYCLRSVRSWCDEVIVVDMLSDDRTPEIAQRYTDKFLTHERVGFVEPARRLGFAAASGDWILNLKLHLAVDAGEIAQMKRKQYADHGSVCTSTDNTAGKSRTGVWLSRRPKSCSDRLWSCACLMEPTSALGRSRG